MVVTPQIDASRAGAAILQAGGNAIDAAIAISLALSVSDPHHSGIGGGGFLLIRLANGEVFAVDARETAPAAASRGMFRAPGVAKDASRWGGLAVATPGLVAGLELARERWGRLEFAALVEPAIRIAEEGFALGRSHARSLAFWDAKLADRFPATAAIQLPVRGQPPEALVGTILRQPEKAATLRHLASAGPGAFYKGELAERMVAAARKAGGILSVEDLAGYRPVLREPTRGTYRGHEVLSFPPPSSGGLALISMLQILEGFDLAERGAGSSRSFHIIAEAMKLAFADRAAYLGDPDFVEIPAWLATPRYAETLRAQINPPRWERSPFTWHLDEVARRVEGPGEEPHDGGTTHFSVVDAEGNAVSATQTINLLFGSGITVPGTGIVLNNEMDDFSIALDTPNAFGLIDTRGANAVAPGKRPLSSMTPTIVLRDDKPFLVTGSPGGPRIITTTLLSILNVIDYGMDVQAAIAAPRIHHQWIPDHVLVEPDIPADVIEGLRARGHNVEVSGRFWSSAQAIAIDAEAGRFYGGTDPRGDGAAIAP
jgi:gamma-glutamyltranspeptidase/glutathione hydrolase